jgi:hypothetical protein
MEPTTPGRHSRVGKKIYHIERRIVWLEKTIKERERENPLVHYAYFHAELRALQFALACIHACVRHEHIPLRGEY